MNISDEVRTTNVKLMSTEKNIHTGTKYNSIQALVLVKLEIHFVVVKAACLRTYN